MPESLELLAFLDAARELPVVDVRSPGEFAQGHVPGAVNLPLFTDEERAEIGTAYTCQGRDAAVLLGLARVGPKLAALGGELARLGAAAGGRLLLHCWRGGMRSASMAWLAEQVGCRAVTLAGGYKSFRRWALAFDGAGRPLRVVAGLTGSGKTAVLRALASRGEPVVDIEELACHKGSAFGALGERPQPTQEQFENALALAWHRCPAGRAVWVEDESRTIGSRFLPTPFWQAKQSGLFCIIVVPEEQRVEHLVRVYGGHPPERLAERIRAIGKRLGGQRTREALEALERGDLRAVCREVLAYYDRTYRVALEAVPAEHRWELVFDRLDPEWIADVLGRQT